MTIVIPEKIQERSTVGFFSPSEPIYSRRVKYIRLGIKILNDWGYSTEELDSDILREWEKLRPLSIRVEEFHNKVKDPSIDVLIATWGGKNASDLLPHLDFELFRKYKKPIIGTSDIAVLLNAITWRAGLVTYHGPNVLGKLNQTKEIGLPTLKENREPNNLFSVSDETEFQILRHGSSTGRLLGGSLGTFTLGLSGTEYMPRYKNIIFFFESASLDYSRTRQHLQHLNMTGFTKNVVGVVIGAMTKIEKQTFNEFCSMILEIFAKPIPIIKCNLFGHGFYYNPTFPIGARAKMDTNNRLLVTLPEIIKG